MNSASNDQGLLNREACTLGSQDIVLFVSFCRIKTATEAEKVKTCCCSVSSVVEIAVEMLQTKPVNQSSKRAAAVFPVL